MLAYSVSRRTQEIGVRSALGADAGDIRRMVIREGIVPAAAGLAAGLVASFWLTRFIATFLFGVTPHDAATTVSVAAMLLAISLVACYLPARRATQVDPVVALRYE